jgi:outer membrane protein OmpA-like peptidoglycan-associated protein
MRILKFIVPVVCALSVSACSGIPSSSVKDIKSASNRTIDTGPSYNKEIIFPDAPTAYYGQNKRGVLLKPPGLAGTPSTPDASGLVWNQLPDYDAQGLDSAPVGDDLAPIGSSSVEVNPVVVSAPKLTPPGEMYNDSVKVFSLDGDAGAPAYAAPVYAGAPSYYGNLEAKVYFDHGSSAIRKTDKSKIRKVASKTKKKGRDVSVTVVGHASRRVDRVKDPVRKKMINLAMAQKRANAVTKELHKAGLKPAWVQAVSRGDEEPNMSPGSMPQEAADRRVEIYMDEK